MAVRVHTVRVVDSTTIALGISLAEHPELRNPRYLTAAMDAYVAGLPNLNGMSAQIADDTLTIYATGTISQEALLNYI